MRQKIGGGIIYFFYSIFPKPIKMPGLWMQIWAENSDKTAIPFKDAGSMDANMGEWGNLINSF
jgi:hypothetical protein